MTNWSIEFSPLVPHLIWQGALVLSLVLAAILLVRRRSGAVLRTAMLGALVLALVNPTLREETREGLSNIAIVLLDRSSSQDLAGRTERVSAIETQLKERFSRIPNLEVRYVDSSRAGSDERETTDLFRDLNAALIDVPVDRLAGVVMVTDGQIHDVPADATGLGFDAPVHALITGARDEFDRRIDVITAPKYSLVGTQAIATIRIASHGAGRGAGRPARLIIRREGYPDEERVAPVGETIEVFFPFPHAGTNLLEIELAPEEGELTFANNRAVLAAEGVRENLRVLLVSGEPHAGERTWRNLLKSDASVDLVHFTILRPPHKQDGTPINQLSLIAFPTRELFQEKLNEFDLIIFDRYQRRNVLPLIYLDNVARYVEDFGGAVLVAAGEDYALPQSLFNTPLSHVLPAEPTGVVIEKPFRPGITEVGAKHPVTRGLPGSLAPGQAGMPNWGRWFRLVDTQSARGNVVMDGADGKPLLVLDRRGRGRVALLLSDHAWLWARGLEGGGPHAQLLRRLAHWLMKEPDLEEDQLSAKVSGRSIQIERRSLGDAVEPVLVRTPDGKERRITLDAADAGVWTSTLEAEVPGIYRLSSGALQALANVGASNSRELAQVVATADVVAPVLEGSGGGSFWTADRPGAAATDLTLPRVSLLSSGRIMHGSGWLALRDRQAYVTRGISIIPLYAGPIALALLLGLMALTWWREGR